MKNVGVKAALAVLAAAALAAWVILPWSRGDNTASKGLAGARIFTDAAGREVTVPEKVDRVICSGSGALRLLTYLEAHDRIVAVDSIELRETAVDARPYALANPQFRDYPLFGEFRGHDNPELIAALRPQPQVIFKVDPARSHDADMLQAKTGIPVVALEYGNLTHGRKALDQSLRLMGEILGVEQRAEQVIGCFDHIERDLAQRTDSIPTEQRPTCYVGGLAHRGPHGFQSTEPSFAPFAFTGARNAAAPRSANNDVSHAMVAKEQIVFWNPDTIFLDVSSLRMASGANGLDELRSDPAYRDLSAVREGRVYGLFPYNSYNQNFEAIFANAYFVGKTLYPERFRDVDPMAKAEEISVFLNGDAVFEALNQKFDGLAFRHIDARGASHAAP